ncbi:acetate--CoA ligase family protein [Shimia sp. NS0008-38b]|uniref:acetate--CoA ligase family protein n=1 Tax=Shimia sp. NS0008-38b TaxID=3127653 RepID=UPI00310BF2A7
MAADLSRLLRPKSIAVIGGGAWCAEVIRQSEKIGFGGDLWPVHPKGGTLEGRTAYQSLDDLPSSPDAAFVGINRYATIDVVGQLAKMNAGGAVCFASGFTEAIGEDIHGAELQTALIEAAAKMPILGPNCYGLINALDGIAIWPDQHGCSRVESGVAILTQSSNIAINLTNQKRGLPIAYVATCGNMAQLNQAQIASAFLDDPRVTAIGLHIEGFTDLRAWEQFAAKAYQNNVPVVALKVGTSGEAQAATISHTASLAGSDAGAHALIQRLGFARVSELSVFLETLKLLHMQGPLPSKNIASISCSGGEASLMADTAFHTRLTFPPLTSAQEADLRNVLGPMVALANPLDYHTYIWRDADTMAKAWSAMMAPDVAMTFSIVDYPHENRSDWACATEAAITARAQTGRAFSVVSSLPELMPDDVARQLIDGGVIPLYGLRDAVEATAAATELTAPQDPPLAIPGHPTAPTVLTEADAKQALRAAGLDTPQSRTVGRRSPLSLSEAAQSLQAPLVLKGQGIAHKTEEGAVRLNLNKEDLESAAAAMPTDSFLIEEMVQGAVAELLLGVTRDAAHGFVLTLAAGGVLAELLEDSTSLLVPSSRVDVKMALSKLKCTKLLAGYRGAPAANIDAILDAVDALQSYVLANTATLEEVEINPLMCTPTRAVAADALIRKEMS